MSDFLQINITQDGAFNTQNNNFTVNVPRKSTSIPSDVRQGSPNFVGRVDDLRDLHEALQKEKIVSVCAVRGMGGVGKTELAIQYALSEEFQSRYVACYWFSLNEGNLTSLVLQKAAPYLAMPEEIQKSDDVYEQVKWCWQNWHPPEGEVLVILDDVKSLDDIPKQAMPINPRFKVMLTTRQRNLSPSFRELQLGVLLEDEALELLKRIVDRDGSSRIEDELETAKEICRYLGYLPLALELAATYLVEDEMLTLGEYWQQLNLQDRSISDEMVKYITAERGVVSAFALSWQRLRDLSPQVAMLLGRFAPAEIPWQDLVEPTVKSLGWDEGAVRKGRIQLANLHLISIREQKNIGIHSLLREYFRWQSDRAGDDFIHFLQRGMASIGIAIAKTISQIPVKSDIERVHIAIPHLDLMSNDMLDDITNLEEDLLRLFVSIAFFYRDQGLYDLAKTTYTNCLNTIKSRLGEDHVCFACILSNLGELYHLQGKYSEAESLFLRSHSIFKKLEGNHPNIAQILNNLAGIYKTQERYSEAEPMFIRALEIWERQTEIDIFNIALTLNNLGELYYLQGKYSEAEPMFIRALEIWKRKSEDDHPLVAIILGNLAMFYKAQGEYSDAEQLCLQSLEIQKNCLGDEHLSVATSLNNLGDVYFLQGRYEEAETKFQSALKIWKNLLGDMHINIATCLNNLARIYKVQQEYLKAESKFLESLEIWKHLIGYDNINYALNLMNLGDLYLSQSNYSEAEPMFVDAHEILKRKLESNHPIFANSLHNLAALYYSQGKYSEAEQLYVQSLEIKEQKLGSDHLDVARSLLNLAVLYHESHRHSEALNSIQRAIQIYEQKLGAEHDETQVALSWLQPIRDAVL